MNDVEVNSETGYISNGIITTYSLAASFSYILNWEFILNKE